VGAGGGAGKTLAITMFSITHPVLLPRSGSLRNAAGRRVCAGQFKRRPTGYLRRNAGNIATFG
jgi:hypothetical protein